ncbi:hypothetical protein NQ317_000009 [Molorchus minor]|uniref:MICOS complex subunit MIC13 n=1 Tax=Molorchus minor TaxID=1323400 RepID=A0ABQ9K201_9CUCU|nr:hypothetical protein NQ317_000009 [Molorchus minor]
MSPDNTKCNKKINLLVYQTPSGQRTDRVPCNKDSCKATYRAPICIPKPKQIRVCTGAELKRMCPPKVCPCVRDKKGSILLALLGFAMKTAIAAGAVYVSYDLGLWGTTDDTFKVYRDYCNILSEPNIQRATKWDPPSCDAEKDLFNLPRFNPRAHCEKPPIDMERQTTAFQKCWNRGIEFVFGSLVGFPNNLMKGLEREKAVKKEACVKMEEVDGVIENNYK